MKEVIKNVSTIRERQLAFALNHAIDLLEERGDKCGWYRNVLSDRLMPGEMQLAAETEDDPE